MVQADVADGTAMGEVSRSPSRSSPWTARRFALGGDLDHARAVSFIVINLPTSSATDVVAVESWFRSRTAIEERFREAKLGAGPV